MHWISAVGYAAVGVLVVGWLVVSFSEPGPRRTRVEWLSATAGFLALVALFASQTFGAESRLGRVSFGFLLVLFSSGLVVSAAQTLLSLRNQRKAESSATH